MSTNARIYLNGHASAEKIFEVILKVTGNEFEYKFFNDRDKPNFELPSSKQNSWYLKPVGGVGKIKTESVHYFTIDFSDCIKNQYNCLIHFDVEDDDYCLNNEKLLSPKSTANWLAIGKRLVDFFGGKMMYSDARDFDDKENWYICKKPKFGKKTKEFVGDERWYGYYNLLRDEPVLTVKEVNQMISYASYGSSEREESLISYLEKYESALNLEKELQKRKDGKNNVKLKV